jgi:hypothetical protein
VGSTWPFQVDNKLHVVQAIVEVVAGHMIYLLFNSIAQGHFDYNGSSQKIFEFESSVLSTCASTSQSIFGCWSVISGH